MKRFFVFFLCLLGCYALARAQQLTIREQLSRMQESYGIHFIFSADLNLDEPSKQLNFQRLSVKEALSLLFQNTSIKYKRSGNNVALSASKRENVSAANLLLSGVITDEQGEPLIDAMVYEPSLQRTTLTDERGRYMIWLPKGSHELLFSSMGMQTACRKVNLKESAYLRVQLKGSLELPEVVVTGEAAKSVDVTQMGRTRFSTVDLKTEYALLSSPDLLKTLQQTSGINGGVELSSGLFVHGGNGDENLFLLDGVPLYQVNHSLGLFSSFNTDVIKQVDFYKCGFPARYSGRVSSIVDVHTCDGNSEQMHGQVAIGLLDGRLRLEGPLRDSTTTFSISLRRSWVDLLLAPLYAVMNSGNDDGEHYSFGYAFHDLNAKVTHHLRGDHWLWSSLYYGEDKYRIHDESVWSHYYTDTRNRFKWGNVNWAIGADVKLSPTMKMSTSVYLLYSHSSHQYVEDDTYHITSEIIRRTSWDERRTRTNMSDVGYKMDGQWHPNSSHRIRYGGNFIHHQFRPQSIQQTFYYGDVTEGVDTTCVRSQSRNSSNELTLYMEDEVSLSPTFWINPGCSYTKAFVDGRSYQSIDPRWAMRWNVLSELSLKASYTHMSQFIHRMASTFLELPTDFWVPITRKIQPSGSNQWAVGAYYQPTSELSLAMECFYKYTNHLLRYRNWQGIQPSADHWDEEVTEGKGKSYGCELDANYRIAQLKLSLSYTLSWSKRLFPELYNAYFYDQFDNRHKLNVMAQYRWRKGVSMFASWMIHSGNRMTVPVQYVLYPQLPGDRGESQGGYVYTSPNNYELPTYHRLDVGMDFRRMLPGGRESVWNVSIYNAYCRMNTLYVKVHREEDNSLTAKSKGFIPMIPSVSYTLKF